MMARLRLNMTSPIIPIIITRIPITRIMVFSSSEGRTFGLHPVSPIRAVAPWAMAAHLAMDTPLVGTLPVIVSPGSPTADNGLCAAPIKPYHSAHSRDSLKDINATSAHAKVAARRREGKRDYHGGYER